MINILFNCTTNVVGGGVKNSAIFIKFVADCDDISWSFAVSPQVNALLEKWAIDVPRLKVFPASPAKSLRSRKDLLEFEKSECADAVYTMAGPSYVSFSSFHIQGISNPHITHVKISDIRFIVRSNLFLNYLLLVAYQSYNARKADYFLFQTESSRKGFCKRLRIDQSRTCVLSNAIDFSAFEDAKALEFDQNKGDVAVFCPAAPYSHKALNLIPNYAKMLRDRGYPNFTFFLTIAQDHPLFNSISREAKNLGVSDMVKTKGVYSYSEVGSVYSASDIVFVPSLLETFSATYLEAFAACRPLVVADREFSKEVCGEAAKYVEPHNSENVVDVLIEVASKRSLQLEMVKAGLFRLNLFGGQETRTEKILLTIKSVLKEQGII